MPYAHIIHAEDGRHVSVYQTAAKAVEALIRNAGQGGGVAEAMRDSAGRELEYGSAVYRYVDDFGRRHVIEWTAARNKRELEAYGDAYDARECGIATKAQLRLLNRLEG